MRRRSSAVKLCALTTARLKYVAMPWSSIGGIVTLTEPAEAFCSLRSLAPVPRTGVTVYVNFLPRSAVLSPPSHQLNFWIGALSLPLGFDAFVSGTKSILLNRNCGLPSLP